MHPRTCQIVSRSLRILCRYPLRSSLVMIIAGTGVAGVVCSVNYAASGTNQLLDQIRRTAATKENLMPSLVEAARARCTVGEIMNALADVFGRYDGAARW